MTLVKVAIVLALAVVSADVDAQTKFNTRAVVERLASDEFEGRLTGSEGIRKAADYIEEQFARIGVEPLPGVDGFRHDFSYTAGVTDIGTVLTVRGVNGTEVRENNFDMAAVRALSFSDVGTADGPLVFAGYGLSVPETDGFSYDSYATLDVADKIVMVLRYFPEDTEGELRGTLARYAGLRYKAFAARERGAKGLIVVTGPRSPNPGQLVPLTFDNAMGDSGIMAVTVDGNLGAALVASGGESIEEVQESLDTANPHVTGFELPLSVSLDVKLERQEHVGHNIIGYLAPTGSKIVAKPYVMLGAHYDHLGYGEGSDSLARVGESGQVHNGADDNASGVAALLSVGSTIAASMRDRGLILALWSGEELGLLGSADFVRKAQVRMDEISSYLNFDMVGRLRENKLTVQAVGSSSVWTELVKELNRSIGFELSLVADPYLPTDVMSLNAAEVPSLAFFTGSHEDYHRPTDDADSINYTGLDRISTLAAGVVKRLLNDVEPPDFVRVEQAVQRAGRATMRIFTGTIPDYAQEVDGLLLSGVIAGGPAEIAGLRGGDVIVGLAGQTISDIYDYTYALDVLRVGQAVEVLFRRDGQEMSTSLTPKARE